MDEEALVLGSFRGGEELKKNLLEMIPAHEGVGAQVDDKTGQVDGVRKKKRKGGGALKAPTRHGLVEAGDQGFEGGEEVVEVAFLGRKFVVGADHLKEVIELNASADRRAGAGDVFLLLGLGRREALNQIEVVLGDGEDVVEIVADHSSEKVLEFGPVEGGEGFRREIGVHHGDLEEV